MQATTPLHKMPVPREQLEIPMLIFPCSGTAGALPLWAGGGDHDVIPRCTARDELMGRGWAAAGYFRACRCAPSRLPLLATHTPPPPPPPPGHRTGREAPPGE